MRTIVSIISTMLLLWPGQSNASELGDAQLHATVEVDSVSLYCDNSLQIQFTYCHKGIFSTFGFSLSADSMEVIKSIDFVSPVKADIPRTVSDQIEIPDEWMKHDKMPIIFSIFFTLYDQDSFECAEIVGKYTYIDTIEVVIKE